jgi:DNA-binding protein H-NS
MAIDLGNMSLKELKTLYSQVAREIEGFVERKKREAVKELEDLAKSHGYSLDELLGAKPSRKRAAAKPKYANPANSAETWTGRGRRPRWVEAALKAGKSLDDLAI